MGRAIRSLGALLLVASAGSLQADPTTAPAIEDQAFTYKGPIPAEFRGLWAYTDSMCVDGKHRRVPETGIFVGNVTFGTFTNGLPDAGQSLAVGHEWTGERQISVAMGPGTEPQVLTLTDQDRLVVQWGERGPFEFIRCSPVEE